MIAVTTILIKVRNYRKSLVMLKQDNFSKITEARFLDESSGDSDLLVRCVP